MFTGIVTDVGRIERLEPLGDSARAHPDGSRAGRHRHRRVHRLRTAFCPTAVDRGPAEGAEPVRRGRVRRDAVENRDRNRKRARRVEAGKRVNLERAPRLGDEPAGTSCRAMWTAWPRSSRCARKATARASRSARPDELARFIAPKGSVVLNGTSLTVNEVDGHHFGVNLIPTTLASTTWATPRRRHGQSEIDTLAATSRVLAEYGSRLNAELWPSTASGAKRAAPEPRRDGNADGRHRIPRRDLSGRGDHRRRAQRAHVHLVDHEDRENEGDSAHPAQMCTPDAINFMAKHGLRPDCLDADRRAARRAGPAADGRVELVAPRDRVHHVHRGARGGDDRHLGP